MKGTIQILEVIQIRQKNKNKLKKKLIQKLKNFNSNYKH